MRVLYNILLAFVATELVEGLVAGLWQSDRKTVLAVLLCNAATNPAVNGIMQTILYFYPKNAFLYYGALVGLELLTILVEGIILNKMLPVGQKKAFLLSLGINCCSFFAGLAITLAA